MAYRYFTSGSPVTLYPPKDTWIYDFNTLLDTEFYNSSDVFTIKEETYFGSGSYINLDVRINTSVEPNTGVKLGDDFKTLLFQSPHDDIQLGEKFFFDSNYWIAVNASVLKSLAQTAIVRRCNNMLRWVDLVGNIYQEHCIIDYNPTTPDNRNRTDPVIPMGTIKVFTQLNTKTNTIREDQRFLFGNSLNWNCYRIYGGGLVNFNNLQTTSNTSARMLELGMGKNFVNISDDNLTLGIADYYKYINPSGSAIVNSIQILPVPSYLLQSGSQVYSCYLMSGTVPLGDVFTFTASGSVPVSHYTLATIDGNHFSVINNKIFMDSPLSIICASGSSNRTVSVELRGAW